MSVVFLKMVNMSISAGWMILAVLIARLFLRKSPRWVLCLLWGAVAIRLTVPFFFESAVCLIPSVETVPLNIAFQQRPALNTGISVVNELINPFVAEVFTPASHKQISRLQFAIHAAAAIWIIGIVIMLTYALFSYLKLKRTVSACITAGKNIMICDEISTPFLLGVFSPVIYVPSSVAGETYHYVILHEVSHIMRHDHWWKPLGFLLASLHWYNPLCWISYVLFCRDIETACDEKVIAGMDRNDRAAYAQALLNCSNPHRGFYASPISFCETGIKERVRFVLEYTKPSFKNVSIALVISALVTGCFLTDPGASFIIDRSSVEKVTYYNAFMRTECQGELSQNQIDEMVDRFAGIHRATRSSLYEGITPGYQFCIFLKDGSMIYANGYDAVHDMVEIIYHGKRYSVDDSDFAGYLRNVCSRGDVTEAQLVPN